MTGIRVTVVATRGSAPREAGAQMFVTAEGARGTIGGGALEWEAMAQARRMLAEGVARAERRISLGPGLGQCCGGAVELRFEAAEGLKRSQGAPLWVWGAGHVGRALVGVLAPLPGVAITWIDTAEDRFPPQVPDAVTRLVAADPPRLMQHAPRDAHHLILTYSHDIDLALCDAALGHGFAGCGLIGSATKWARFRSRLAAMGHGIAEISRIDCPIGDPSLGKHPQAIAVGVAARLLKEHMPKEAADGDSAREAGHGEA
ncbi:xanthine dehydrogenase accessory protein XdhC [Roseibacterium sp. SDUM158017]|uniref:xanthine dehydrogenase accessory protein XdhC n=1 Tax=Roseicyclus salinarum TaxID=3036773 RepID=UPI0024151578|nr:xanthine dehydrogenase accessory protein XdhC [Roseibacterium sp. SDUM158017]MDG4647248.1 xanthine dehydrogenase accessory protein XdhC [Roseibacterium sp. SDUM158017]